MLLDKSERKTCQKLTFQTLQNGRRNLTKCEEALFLVLGSRASLTVRILRYEIEKGLRAVYTKLNKTSFALSQSRALGAKIMKLYFLTFESIFLFIPLRLYVLNQNIKKDRNILQ